MTTSHLSDERAQAFVDAALPEADHAECAAHLAGCDECRLVVESYRALGDALDGLDAPPLPADFTRAVMARIDVVERARAIDRWLAGGILGGAVAVAALLAALAGADAWVSVTTALATGAAAVARVLTVSADVASPLFHALRLQITVACCLAALALLLSFWRLLPRPRELAVRS